MFNSIRIRLIAYSVVLIAVPIILAVGLVGRQTTSALTNQALVVQDEVASREASQVFDFFKSLEHDLKLTTEENGLVDGTSIQQQIILSKLLSRTSAFDKIYLLDSTGMEIVGVSRTVAIASSDLKSRAQADEYKVPAATNQIFYGQVRTDEATGEPLVALSIPIQDLRTGKLAAVLVADIRFFAIQDIIQDTEPTDVQRGLQTNVYLIDSQSAVVAHSDPAVTLRGLRFTLSAPDGVENGLNGSSAVLASTEFKLGNQVFTLVAETPIAQALAVVNDTTKFILGVLVVALLLGVFGALFVANQIVRPILALVATARAIQGGDLSKRSDVKSKDEIGSLAKSFNNMTEQLQSTLKGLQDHVNELEKARVEREKLINDLQAAKRIAEENSRLKSEFLSTMSHELRTPMNAIEGFTGIMLSKMAGVQFNAKAEDFIRRISSNSKRLLALINDFLDLSRIESGRMDLASSPFSPAALADKWKSEISVLAEKKGLAFTATVDPNLPNTVYGDEEAVSKVAINLLGNAIKFTEKGHVDLALERGASDWTIKVTDTGIGIPPHAREFIFDEFRQVDQTSKRKYGGTGLGLAIVQKFVRSMGGTVTVQSEVGQGSVFTVSLPLVESLEKAGEKVNA